MAVGPPRDVALSRILEKYLQTCAKGEGPTGCSGSPYHWKDCGKGSIEKCKSGYL